MADQAEENDVPHKQQVEVVSYVVDDKLLDCCDALPPFSQRAHLTHELIASYGFLGVMRVVPSEPATEEDIRKFHSQEYVEFLQKEHPESETQEQALACDEFGLGYDCPILKNMWDVVCALAGGSLTAARELTSGRTRLAVNWWGGWHHAQRDQASGYCYVNDIVLAISQLLTVFPKVLYIDLDVHHGDGVENAYLFSPKVFTVSFHQREAGFFPCTGDLEDVGLGRGRLFSLNVPYKGGITDKEFVHLFKSIIGPLCEVYKPDAVVCQCGADSLSQDPVGNGNLTLLSYTTCVADVANLSKPTLFLGGGGYNEVNAARLWTAIMGTLYKCYLPKDIPEHKFFLEYGPSFELDITPGLVKSSNTKESLDYTIKVARRNIEKLAELLGKEQG